MGIHQKEIFFKLSSLLLTCNITLFLQSIFLFIFFKKGSTLCLLDDCNKLIRLPFVVNDSTEIANWFRLSNTIDIANGVWLNWYSIDTMNKFSRFWNLIQSGALLLGWRRIWINIIINNLNQFICCWGFEISILRFVNVN